MDAQGENGNTTLHPQHNKHEAMLFQKTPEQVWNRSHQTLHIVLCVQECRTPDRSILSKTGIAKIVPKHNQNKIWTSIGRVAIQACLEEYRGTPFASRLVLKLTRTHWEPEQGSPE